MPDAKQQQPSNLWPHITLDLPRGIYRYKTIDIMSMAGYSKTLARQLLNEHKVWLMQVDYDETNNGKIVGANWAVAGNSCWVNFLMTDQDRMIAVQPGPYYDGGRITNKATGMTRPHPDNRVITADRVVRGVSI